MNLQEHAKRVAKLTQDNRHTEARLLIAQYVIKKHNTLQGTEKLVKACKAIQTLHNFYGHMSPELSKMRKSIENAIFSFLNEEESKVFYDTL